jgi:hypothetical protein
MGVFSLYRDGPLEFFFWGGKGGGANTKKNSSKTLTKEKNILHKKPTGKKSCKAKAPWF